MTLAEWQSYVRARIIDNEKRRITPAVLRDVLERMGTMLFETVITTQKFDTVADLKTEASPSVKWMYATEGQLTALDGNGHLYVWKPDSTETADDLNVVTPTHIGNGAGRFVVYS